MRVRLVKLGVGVLVVAAVVAIAFVVVPERHTAPPAGVRTAKKGMGPGGKKGGGPPTKQAGPGAAPRSPEGNP